MCLGIPGQIVEITDATRQMAMADVSGVRREVSLAPVASGPLDALVGGDVDPVMAHIAAATARASSLGATVSSLETWHIMEATIDVTTLHSSLLEVEDDELTVQYCPSKMSLINWPKMGTVSPLSFSSFVPSCFPASNVIASNRLAVAVNNLLSSRSMGWESFTLDAKFVRNNASSTAVLPPPITTISCPR